MIVLEPQIFYLQCLRSEKGQHFCEKPISTQNTHISIFKENWVKKFIGKLGENIWSAEVIEKIWWTNYVERIGG